MPWFYNSLSGELTHADGIDALPYEGLIHAGIGWHELHVADSATEAQAAADAQKEVPGGATPTTSLLGGLGQAAEQIPEAAGKAAAGATGLATIVSDLTSRNLWLRAAKITVGIALVIAGIIQLARVQNVAAAAVRGALR